MKIPLSAGLMHKVNYFLEITPWSKVLPERLTNPPLLKKFPAFYGMPKFITAFAIALHLSLSLSSTKHIDGNDETKIEGSTLCCRSREVVASG
jgi:hypothetical protein